MTISELFEARKRVHSQMVEINQRSQGNPDAADQVDLTQFDKLNAEYERLSKLIEQEQRLQAIAAANQPEPAAAGAASAESRTEEQIEREHLTKWFRYLQRGEEALDRESRRLLKEIRKKSGVRLSDADFETRGTNVIANEVSATYGGYLVPITVWTELERRMKAFGGMMQACRVINTRDGGTLYWPTNDDTSATGAWVSEPRSQALTVEDSTFNRVTYNAYTWATTVKFTFEMLQDENVDLLMEQLIEMVSERGGRALNAAFTTGSGTGRPTGLLTSTSAGKTAASATAITKAEIIDLIHSVDPAYRTGASVGFMMHDSVLAYVRKLDVGSSDTIPLWQSSMQAGVPERLFGYPVYINQDMDNTVAATKKTMVFGDFSKYIIREVARPSNLILRERYADELHQAIVTWMRYDGKLLQSNAIKHFLQS